MVAPRPTEQRLLDIGPAAWFRPQPADPPANQVVIKPGILYTGGHQIVDRVSGGDQTTAGFSTVAAGQRRYDLVYVDANGQPQILPGTALAAATAAFEGAPGWDQGGTAGPALPDQATPVAWVLIDESATVVVDADDIFQINAQLKLSRDFDGYLIDKGLFGGAPAGNSDDVSALFAGESAGGSDSVVGVVTTPALNVVHIVDQDGNDLILAAGPHQVYGRITEAAGTWTLTYFADVAGVETVVDVSTDITTAPTDLRLIGVPKVFSRHDPNRPLFPSSVARLSDLAAGDVPPATATQAGKVRITSDGATTGADLALATDDARTGAVQGRANAGAVSGHQPIVRLIQGSNVTVSLTEAGGELQFTISATTSGAFPGFDGNTPLQDSGSGSAGGSGLASRGDHVHPASSVYTSRDGLEVTYQNFAGQQNLSSGALSFRPRAGLFFGHANDTDFFWQMGVFVGTASNQQGHVFGGPNNNADFQTGEIARSSQSAGADLARWPVSTFSEAGGVVANRNVVAGAPTAVLDGNWVILGDNL